jgi:DNA-binding Lrp family transcriptional regulator
MKKLKGVDGTFLVSGLYDVVASVKARTAEEILALVYDKVRRIPGVKGSQTMFALEV